MKTLVVPVLSVGMLACSAGPAPVSSSPHDPSNPSALEGVVGAEGHGRAHGAPAGSAGDPQVVHACPMHPEVVASAPGSCPKCGMTLVARQKELTPERP